jgi:hypothetical protein
MLEYLYDLVEPPERQELEAHVAVCTVCQAELERARGQQRLLASAARMEFAQVRFVPPEPEPTAVQTAPVTLPLTPSASLQRRSWKRWAIAAAVLLLLGGVAGPSAWYGRGYLEARRTAEARGAALASARERLSTIQSELSQMPLERQKRAEEVEKALRAKELKAAVIGPASAPAGAPADYDIETQNLDGQPVPANLNVQVVDGTQPLTKSLKAREVALGRYRVTLPADLPVRSGSQPALVVSASRADSQSKAELREELRLTAPVYLTHLTTDKPMYQPGETVRFRSLTLDRSSLKPAQTDFHLIYSLQPPQGPQIQVTQGPTILIRGQEGGPAVLGPDGKPLRGIGTGEYALPENAAGGEWILSVRDEHNRFSEQQRKFLVNEYQKPRFDKELDFNRTTYGPGDEVQARCKARAVGSPVPLKDFQVAATVTVDGQTYGADGMPSGQPLLFTTDAEGAVTVRFRLPRQIERGQASVAVRFGEEALVRTIPIVLKKLNVEFYPEGGYLVSDLPNRVYFQARTPLGKPAELKGQLLEDGNRLGVAVETLHDDKEPGVNQGMGKFSFTPKAGRKYEIEVETPAKLEGRPALPAAEADKVVLSVPQGLVAADQPIAVEIHSVRKRSLLVGAYCRGRLLDSVKIEPIHYDGTTARGTLKPASAEGGVCRMTVFEALEGAGGRGELRPVAERLIYRQPAERLNLNLETDRTAYVPRQEVKLGLEATDEKGKPAPTVAMVAVVDKSVITLADEKTARSMPTHFLLTTEVRRPEDLEYADFFLGTHPRAAEALDLLLGTQGWRRFAEQDPAKFRQEHKEEAERLLVVTGQSAENATDFAQRQRTQAARECDEKEQRLREEVAGGRAEVQTVEHDPQYMAALAALASYDDFFDRMGRNGPPAAGLILVLATLVFLVKAARRGLARALPYWAAAAVCCVALVMVLELYIHQREQMAAAARDKTVALAESVEHAAGDKGDVPPPPAPQRMAAPRMMAPMAKPGGLGGFPGGGPGQGGQGQGGGAPNKAPMPAAAEQPAFGLAREADKAKNGIRLGMELNAGKGGEGKDFAYRRGGLPDGKGEQMKPIAPRALAGRPNAAMPMAAGAMFKRAEEARDLNGPFAAASKVAQKEAAAEGWERQASGLRRQLEAKQQLQFLDDAIALRPLVVREYSHNPAPPADPSLRSDWAETLYWHPVLVLPEGKAEVSFKLCDSPTSFQATVFAHTLDGRLGAATRRIESRLPLAVRPRTPIEVTAGDRVEVPVALTNNTDRATQVGIRMTTYDNLKPLGNTQEQVPVGPQATSRKFFALQPRVQEGKASLAFEAKGDGFPDGARLDFRVVPEGFPVVVARSDVLETSATQAVELPKTWVKGTLKCQVNVYPSTLADLQKGLDALLREPCGCFEQTSTSNYPNLLILDYLRESGQARPEVERRARDLVARGYEKLTSFECTNNSKNAKEGYEWFGGTAPAHEALTAYGLMEFRDMARVQEVDGAMLERTKSYLLACRDGKGGFSRNPRALDTFGAAPPDITNAYIVWAITAGGKDDDVAKELNALVGQAESSKDPYFLSLVANSLINRARTDEATALLKKVAAAQKDDGHLDAETTSITHSGGRDLQIETTALAVLGWLKANPGMFRQPVEKAVRWIGQQRGGYGGYGSTQSTILALKALIEHTRANKKTAEAGTLELFVNDKAVSRLDFSAGVSDALTLMVPNAEQVLKPGKNKVRVDISGKNVFPYTLTLSYQTLQPASAADCPVRLSTKLAKAEGQEGESVRLTVGLENVSGKGQGMAVAVVGLPGGMALPEDLKQLKEHARVPEDGSRPLVSAFEVRGRELVLYWRDLAPDQKIEVPLNLVCRVPGTYSGPASRAYLYYNADHKHWVEPLKMTITARPE